jgi:hypothetical protein
MRNRKHSLAKAVRPLVCVSFSTAGAYPAIASFCLENPLLTMLAIKDKATANSTITIDCFLDFFYLVVGWTIVLEIFSPTF